MPHSTARARKDGFYLLLIGAFIFPLFGYIFERVNPYGMVDFDMHYFTARTLLDGRDPYDSNQVLKTCALEGLELPPGALGRISATHYPYPPSEFIFTSPIALLPTVPARIAWKILNLGSLILGAILVWRIAARYAPILSGALAGWMLANSEILAASGNIAAVAIGLGILAVWCFYESKLQAVGTVSLAIALALKPQDIGLLWIFLLLAGGGYRKYALRASLISFLLGISSTLWVTHVVRDWPQELRNDLAIYSTPGGMNDPGPFTNNVRGGMINLQTVASRINSDPRAYDAACYLICGTALAICFIQTLRRQPDVVEARPALASIAALTLLIVYHRRLDSPLLLLAIPACAQLWSEHSRSNRWPVIFTLAAFFLTGDLPLIFTSAVIGGLKVSPQTTETLRVALQTSPAPLALLCVAFSYLWVYWRKTSTSRNSCRFV